MFAKTRGSLSADRSGSMTDRSRSLGALAGSVAVYGVVDDLVKQFFGILLTSYIETINTKSTSVFIACAASNNDLKSQLLNCFEYI